MPTNEELWNQALFGGPAPPPTVKILDLIYDALRIGGILTGAGRQASPEENSEGIRILNAMIDSWNTERLMLRAIRRDVYDLVPSKDRYTIGPFPSDFVGLNPTKIEMASWVQQSSSGPLEKPIAILTVEKWQSWISVKSTPSTLPQAIYIEYSQPRSGIHVWPVPSEVNQLALYQWTQLSGYMNVQDEVIVQPGMLKALQYNLGKELALRWPGAKMSPLALAEAVEAKANVKRLNAPIVDLRCDPAVVGTSGMGTFNWITGEPDWRG